MLERPLRLSVCAQLELCGGPNLNIREVIGTSCVFISVIKLIHCGLDSGGTGDSLKRRILLYYRRFGRADKVHF